MDDEGGYGAGREAGDGLDEGWREALMFGTRHRGMMQCFLLHGEVLESYKTGRRFLPELYQELVFEKVGRISMMTKCATQKFRSARGSRYRREKAEINVIGIHNICTSSNPAIWSVYCSSLSKLHV